MPGWAGLDSWDLIELLLQPFASGLVRLQEALVLIQFRKVGLAIGILPQEWGLLL